MKKILKAIWAWVSKPQEEDFESRIMHQWKEELQKELQWSADRDHSHRVVILDEVSDESWENLLMELAIKRAMAEKPKVLH